MMRLVRNRAGATMLEFALVAPVFLALVGGTIELSRWALGAAATRDLAARAARCITATPERCRSAAATRAAMAHDAPMMAGATRLDFRRAPCGVLVVARGGFPALLTPGLGETRAVACAG
jgi:Flp pilus assembly protein TadG